MTKYEDLRPCAYDLYHEEDHAKFKKTVCGRFHKFVTYFDEGSSCGDYAIIELDDGAMETVGMFAGQRFQLRNFRFTDHDKPSGAED